MTIEPRMLTLRAKMIGGALALVLVLMGGSALYFTAQEETTPAVENGWEIEGLPEGATVEIVDRVNEELFNSTPRPSLTRVLPQAGASAEVYAIMLKQRTDAVALIEENPASMTQWLGLGVLHKQAGDYEGARIYFTYVATVNPENIAAHWNLGQLYVYYLKNSTLAEASFRKAISVDPTFTSSYVELYQLLLSEGKQDAAKATLEAGAKNNPDVIELHVLLARHFKAAGDTIRARASYDAAIAAAEKAKDANATVTLRAEKAAL